MIGRNILFVLLAIGISGLQCAKEGAPAPAGDKPALIECDASAFSSPTTTSCDPDQNLPPDIFCGFRYEGPIGLLPPTRHQIKYLCPAIRQVTFVNGAGEFVTLAVEKTSGYFERQDNEPCPGGEGREILVCSESESAWVYLRNRAAGLEFYLGMDVGDRDPVHPERSFDRVGISLQKVEGEPAYSWPYLHYRIDPDGITRLMTPDTYFAEQLELGGKVYLDVIYRRPPEADPYLLEVYFNTTFGIIGFRDHAGEVWTFREFN